MARYLCGDEARRAAVRNSPLNGIDFLEVEAHQRVLKVVFLNLPAPAGITPENVKIEGGVRITNVRAIGTPYDGDVLKIQVDKPGDFSVYTLRLQNVSDLDSRLSAVKFSFKVDCPNDFDCRSEAQCPPRRLSEPEINYLAKDYSSFRRLVLDRLSAIVPDWHERNPADMGIALVELMAYVGDQLSYYQDAVATEAYLGTARKRVSARRHARLVDYYMHNGCNARVWIQFEADAPIALPKHTQVLTRNPNQQSVISTIEATRVLAERPVVFETMYGIDLHPGYHELHFYTWSDRECCLPAGSTEATLAGSLPELHKDDILIFEEVLGPKTGAAFDADPGHRHAVRLTKVEHAVDKLNQKEVVEIAWTQEDALPFPLCISTITDDEHGARYIENVSIARGNVVLANHGQWLYEASNPVVGEEIGAVPSAGRFRPVLRQSPLTQAVSLPENFNEKPAASLFLFTPREAKPCVYLDDADSKERWQPQQDLLSSDKFAAEFVAEMEEDGLAHIRFGDDVHGKQPTAGTAFVANYRIGNGLAGNVGAEALGSVITDLGGIIKVRNPLPANGGQDPEKLDEVRRYAPQAFRVQQRAVTEDDYARVAERDLEVQRAVATFRWTGSWHTVFVSVDRRNGLPVDYDFKKRIQNHLNFYRMAGYDLEVDGPQFVPLDIAMKICVKADYFRSDVKKALIEKFSNHLLADGGRGFFHPDNWTFGQPIYLSRIFAAACTVAGVGSVILAPDDSDTYFKRWGKVPKGELENGILNVGRTEIARLDNDPNFRENGRIEFIMQGGK